MTICVICGAVLDSDRADFLEEHSRTPTCMHCSSERPKVCFTDYSHKTAPSLVVVGNDAEAIRRAERAYRRAR